MNIEAMCHVIRACQGVTNHKKFLVVGSQSILGHCLERGYDFEFNESSEIDITSVPDSPLVTDLISGALGEETLFHKSFGYFVDGVDFTTSIFPEGWENRVKETTIEGATVYFPSIEDLMISKYIAGRDKDLRFVEKVWQEDMVDAEKMLELFHHIPQNRVNEQVRSLVKARIDGHMARYAQNPGVSPCL